MGRHTCSGHSCPISLWVEFQVRSGWGIKASACMDRPGHPDSWCLPSSQLMLGPGDSEMIRSQGPPCPEELPGWTQVSRNTNWCQAPPAPLGLPPTEPAGSSPRANQELRAGEAVATLLQLVSLQELEKRFFLGCWELGALAPERIYYHLARQGRGDSKEKCMSKVTQ